MADTNRVDPGQANQANNDNTNTTSPSRSINFRSLHEQLNLIPMIDLGAVFIDETQPNMDSLASRIADLRAERNARRVAGDGDLRDIVAATMVVNTTAVPDGGEGVVAGGSGVGRSGVGGAGGGGAGGGGSGVGGVGGAGGGGGVGGGSGVGGRVGRFSGIVLEEFRRVGGLPGLGTGRARGTGYNKPCLIAKPEILNRPGVYTCMSCLETFTKRDKYIDHINGCADDDSKNECPICLNRMNPLVTLNKCYKCSNVIGCKDCIKRILIKDGRLMKYYQQMTGRRTANTMESGAGIVRRDTELARGGTGIDYYEYISCGIKCPFCRTNQHIPLDVATSEDTRRADIILQNIKNIINENQKRKTIDKEALVRLIESM